MLVPFFRTLILYIFIIVAFRLMGKRQVAEMQATEFVITILVSAVASVPMQDLNIPLLHGIVPILTLISAEIFISVISLRSMKLRSILSGKPIKIITDGVIDQKALRKMRITLDDVFESLRLKDVFDLRTVQFAQVETNGQISIILTPESQPATPTDLSLSVPKKPRMEILVSDGALYPQNLTATGHTEKWLKNVLHQNGVEQLKDVFLLCADETGNLIFYRKEKG